MLESAYETVVSFLLYHKQIAENVWYFFFKWEVLFLSL